MDIEVILLIGVRRRRSWVVFFRFILVAVGTTIAGRAPHRSLRARIRLLPRMNDVEALVGIGMQDTRVRKSTG
jgi:hypothetical protein